MKKIFFFLLTYLTIVNQSFAADNYLWISNGRLRSWNVDIHDIPLAIRSAINFFMWIAGTIAVIFVVIGAYKILFGSLQQDKTKWRDTIIMALGGFALAALSWMIVGMILDNLG